jgi:hypothetical protein
MIRICGLLLWAKILLITLNFRHCNSKINQTGLGSVVHDTFISCTVCIQINRIQIILTAWFQMSKSSKPFIHKQQKFLPQEMEFPPLIPYLSQKFKIEDN